VPTSTIPYFFTGRVPFLPPNQQCQSTEGKNMACNKTDIKPIVQLTFVMVNNAPITRHRASRNMYSLTLRVRVMLPQQRNPCTDCKSAQQLGGIPYHSAKLHPGPCYSVGMGPRTDRQTGTQTRVTTIHFASSTTHAKCNDDHNKNVIVLFATFVYKNTNVQTG